MGITTFITRAGLATTMPEEAMAGTARRVDFTGAIEEAAGLRAVAGTAEVGATVAEVGTAAAAGGMGGESL